MSPTKNPGEFRRIVLSMALGAVVIAVALVVSLGLAARKKPPVQAEITERAMRVDVVAVRHESVPVTITGFGEARARDEITLSPEVSGRVESVHPRLDVGEVIPAGEPLFTIDARDYKARVAEAESAVAQLEAAIARWEKQYETDRARLDTYASTRDLAKRDFERTAKLFKEQNIESETAAGQKEAQYNTAQDAYNQFVQQLELYPIQIQEAKSSLAAAHAALERARTDLERTVVTAPFDARLKSVNVEANEWVSPGTTVLTLADDSVLEISVPLNSVDVGQWLQFKPGAADGNRAWFGEVENIPVEVAWSEAVDTNVWSGMLNRVAKYDEETRTVTVVVHVPGSEAQTPELGTLPLVEGMFCRVRIPGKTAAAVVQLPAESVGFDADASGMRTVYVAKKSEETSAYRLATRKVKESHADGQSVYLSEGLDDGELVIVTRLVNPLENALLDFAEPAN